MTVKKERQGTVLIMTPDDRLDTLTAPELEEEFKNELNGIDELIMDFSNVEYITSAGIRALLVARRMLQGKGTMKVIHANEVVQSVFSVTGCSSLFGIE